jgi:hypothetical protein
VYDGTPLTNAGCTITKGALLAGDTLVAEALGTITDAGAWENRITPADIRIMRDGIDVTRNYVITPVHGTLTVLRRALTLTGNAGTFTYNQQPHAVADPATGLGYTYESQNGDRGLIEGHTLSDVILAGDTRTVVGSNPVTPSGGRITGSGADVTANYELQYADGQITIERCPLTLKPNSLTAVYNGLPHTIATIAAAGNLGPSHEITFALSGNTATDVVNSQQVEIAWWAIVDRDTGEDVSGNYEVTTGPGFLTVTPASLHVYGTTEINAWTGNFFQPKAFAVGLKAYDWLAAYDFAKLPARAIGVYKGAFLPGGTAIRDGSNRDVTKNYSITYHDGLQIIRGPRTKYRIEYYYNGILDSSATVTVSGYRGDVISGYPDKVREGYVLDQASGLPLTLRVDPELNVIRVDYASKGEFFRLLVGAGICLSVGDAVD